MNILLSLFFLKLKERNHEPQCLPTAEVLQYLKVMNEIRSVTCYMSQQVSSFVTARNEVAAR